MMKLSDSTRRALRTMLHAVLAIPAVLALLPSGSPFAAKSAAIVAAVAAVSALINKLEDAGLIPSWLKNAPVVDDAPVSDGDSPTEAEAGGDSSITLPDGTVVVAKGGAAGVAAPVADAAV